METARSCGVGVLGPATLYTFAKALATPEITTAFVPEPPPRFGTVLVLVSGELRAAVHRDSS